MNIVPDFVRRHIAHRPSLLKIVDNIGWLFFDRILRMGVGLLVGVWIARYLGPEQFGLLNFANAFIGLFGAIAGLGLQGIVVRDIVRDPENARLTLGTSAVLQLVGGLVAYLLILGAIAYLRSDDTLARTIVAILGATMLFKASEIAVYWFESQVQSKYTVWVQNSVFLIFATIKVALILNHAPLLAFVWTMLAEAALVALILIIVMSRHRHNLSSLKATLKRAKTLLKQSWQLILSATAVLANMNIDKIFVLNLHGAAENGIYVAAQNLVQVFFFLPVVIGASITPWMVNTRHIRVNKYKKTLLYFYVVFGVGGLLFSAIIWLFSTEIIYILYGSEYQASSEVLAVTAWALSFVFLASMRNRELIIDGDSKMVAALSILGLSLNIALLGLLTPTHGAIGAAYAFTLSWALNIALYPALALFINKPKPHTP